MWGIEAYELDSGGKRGDYLAKHNEMHLQREFIQVRAHICAKSNSVWLYSAAW
jgi:hypothetical protein